MKTNLYFCFWVSIFETGNPFPPLFTDTRNNRNLIHNILLDEARKEYRAQKYADLTEKLSQESDKKNISTVAGIAQDAQSVVEEKSVSSDQQELASSSAEKEKLTEQEAPSSANKINSTSEEHSKPPPN